MRADLAVWDVAQPAELAYRIGFNPLAERLFAGAGMLTPGAVTLAALEAVWRGGPAALDPAARPAIEAAAARVAAAVAAGAPVYGVNTGFGKLASVTIPAADTARLQRNLILSHCSGVGDADARGGRAADDGAEARLARPRRLRRALGAGRRCSQAMLRPGRGAGGAGAGLGRRLAATSRRSRTWRR